MTVNKKPCSFENCQQEANPKNVKSEIIWKESDVSWKVFESYCKSSENSENYKDYSSEDYYDWKKSQKGYQDFSFSYYCDWCWKQLFTIDPDTFLKSKPSWEYTNNKSVKEMTTRQLKKAIQKDIEELKEILPLEEGLLPDENDEETWDSDACGDLLKEMNKITIIITSQNGLNDKLEEWSYRAKSENEGTDDF
ncbi:MAG: hypothetical protein MRERV_36c007 [Mycoplasmataceae bacterium RV_VA103A]|nr:MAG: hypothetical protein MRERV_36c007 [Mycoplasmataceae bacterium RV_VA103A]